MKITYLVELDVDVGRVEALHPGLPADQYGVVFISIALCDAAEEDRPVEVLTVRPTS